jgi:hypothetical protein
VVDHTFPACPREGDHWRLARALAVTCDEVQARYDRWADSDGDTRLDDVVIDVPDAAPYTTHPTLGRCTAERLAELARTGPPVHVTVHVERPRPS